MHDYFKKISPERYEALTNRLVKAQQRAADESYKAFQEEFTEEEREGFEKTFRKRFNLEFYIATFLRLVILGFYMFLVVMLSQTIMPPLFVLGIITLWMIGHYWPHIVGTDGIPRSARTPLEALTHDAFLDMLLLGTLTWCWFHFPPV